MSADYLEIDPGSAQLLLYALSVELKITQSFACAGNPSQHGHGQRSWPIPAPQTLVTGVELLRPDMVQKGAYFSFKAGLSSL